MRGYPDRDFPCRGFFVRGPHAVRVVIVRADRRACGRDLKMIRTPCGPRPHPTRTLCVHQPHAVREASSSTWPVSWRVQRVSAVLVSV